MARVCTDKYPVGTFKHQKLPGFYMDDLLKAQIDILLKNIKNDWDFTIIISGSGEVRVGKSVLAMQVAAYWADQIEKLYGKKVIFDLEHNFVFEGDKLIEKGNFLGENYKYSPLIFDEAGADLESKKVLRKTTQQVLDYFRECGQYNLLNLLVIPEFFDLPRGIAITRSIFLLDVYYLADEEGIFRRGFFKFYSRRAKKRLYLLGKKDLDYSVVPPDFSGARFTNFYPIDEQAYRKAKQVALLGRSKERETISVKLKDLLKVKQRNASWYILTEKGIPCKNCRKNVTLSLRKLSEMLTDLTDENVYAATISDAVKSFKKDAGIEDVEENRIDLTKKDFDVVAKGGSVNDVVAKNTDNVVAKETDEDVVATQNCSG